MRGDIFVCWGIDFASFYDFALNAPTLVKINYYFNCITPLYCMFSEEAVNTNSIVLLIENKSWSKHEGNLELEPETRASLGTNTDRRPIKQY